MERNFSVDDVVGEIWRYGAAGLGRTESADAVQHLLKQVPSASNLQNVQPGEGQGNGCVANGGGPGASAPAPASGDAGGVPRVASLDFLRQFMVPGQGGLGGGVASGEAPTGTATSGAVDIAGGSQIVTPNSINPALQPDLSALSAATAQQQLTAALSGLSGLQPGTALMNPLAAAGLNPVAAAALQLQQLGQLGKPVDKEEQEKAEERRARRMLSNRESARRSRRRKQEHLKALESEMTLLADEKQQWGAVRELLEARCHSAEDAARKLREENEILRQKLQLMQHEIELIKCEQPHTAEAVYQDTPHSALVPKEEPVEHPVAVVTGAFEATLLAQGAPVAGDPAIDALHQGYAAAVEHAVAEGTAVLPDTSMAAATAPAVGAEMPVGVPPVLDTSGAGQEAGAQLGALVDGPDGGGVMAAATDVAPAQLPFDSRGFGSAVYDINVQECLEGAEDPIGQECRLAEGRGETAVEVAVGAVAGVQSDALGLDVNQTPAAPAGQSAEPDGSTGGEGDKEEADGEEGNPSPKRRKTEGCSDS